jgi:hypothetical protein
MAVGDRTPDGERIVPETFADEEGNPVAPDDPNLTRIEVEVTYPNGKTRRTYLQAR